MRSWSPTLLLIALFVLGCRPAEETPERSFTEPPNRARTMEPPPASLSPGALTAPDDPTLPAGTQAGRKHALLVGCTRYDKLPDHRLEGPANDVVLMRRVLKERFGFADRDIVTLAESNAAGRPTRANIKAQFERLAKVAGPKDHIMILLSGH